MDLEPKIARAFYFKILKTTFWIFIKLWIKYVYIGNDVYDKNAKSQS
jgi:hypothetical protein